MFNKQEKFVLNNLFLNHALFISNALLTKLIDIILSINRYFGKTINRSKLKRRHSYEPTALDWANLVKQIPVEDVKIDENGYFDPKKSPDFHDWMTNG